MATNQYEIFNNSGEDLSNFPLQDVVNGVEGDLYAQIPDGESYVFLGNDIHAVEIQRRMRDKCAFLGIDYGKTGAYITISDYIPPEE
jgi:hypothetical protein